MDWSNELWVEELVDEIKRRLRRRIIKNKKINVTTVGVRFSHGLNVVPAIIECNPLSDIRVWFFQEPDAQYIYLKSSGDGNILLTVKDR